MTGLVRGAVVGILAAAAMLAGCRAEERMLATPGKPAIVPARPASAALLGAADIGASRLILTIVAFTPPSDKKPVEIVVRAAAAGQGRELGRVAIMPYAAFRATDTARRQNLTFALPADLAGEKTLTLEVALVPVLGGGKDASLEVGGAAIR